MTPIPQFNPTGRKIPFWIVANSGNFSGAGGANPTVQLNYENATGWVDATGAILDVGNGGYRYTPSAQDASVPGIVLARVIGPSGDIEIPFQFCVQQPSFWQQLLAIPQNLADMRNDLRELRNIQAPIQDRI